MKKNDSDIFNKLILVFYVDVSNVPPPNISEYIRIVREATTPPDLDDSNKMLRYFIPINGPNRLECLNPPVSYCCNNKKSKSFVKKLEETNNRLDRLLESMFPVKRRILTEKV